MSKARSYEVHHIGTLEEVLQQLPYASNRLKTILTSQVCVECGVVGSLWRFERMKRQNHSKAHSGGWHWNLYAVRPDGGLTMMTSDHIVAKSRGGGNGMENRQTMCAPCNSRKGNKLPEEQHAAP